MTDAINTAIAAYIAKLTEMASAYHAKHLPNVPVPVYSATFGPKRAKIIEEDPRGTSRSAHSFVDLATGDILMAASWSAPAKGKRGSVYSLDQGGFNHYGADYRR